MNRKKKGMPQKQTNSVQVVSQPDTSSDDGATQGGDNDVCLDAANSAQVAAQAVMQAIAQEATQVRAQAARIGAMVMARAMVSVVKTTRVQAAMQVGVTRLKSRSTVEGDQSRGNQYRNLGRMTTIIQAETINNKNIPE